MSACLSLPISAAAVDAGHDVAGPDPVSPDLLTALATVTDPRAARGVRHLFVAVLAIGVGAVLGGARTYTAIAEWAHDLPVGVRVALGMRRRAPSESTIRRTLQAVDAEALDQTVSAWLATRPTSPPTSPAAMPAVRPAVQVIALDGKSARGARGPDGRATHLLAAFDHDSGVVLGQTVVEGKTNERWTRHLVLLEARRNGFLYRSRRAELHREGHAPDYPTTVATPWRLACDQLSTPAWALLNLLAWYAPDTIPLVLQG